MRRFAATLVTVLVLVLITSGSDSRERNENRRLSSFQLANSPPQVRPFPSDGPAPASRSVTAPGDSFTLAHFTFDNSVGGPDTEGWITADISGEPDTFFHVDDFAGLAGGYSPLEGDQSLWCGVRPDPVRFPGYATLPGYGNSWFQLFSSEPFACVGNVTVSFLIRYDSEATYDYTLLWYRSIGTNWLLAASFDGQGDSLVTVVIPDVNLGDEIELRFVFDSDSGWSDQDGLYSSDGAVIIDSLTVADATGVLDYQDFESEAPGSTTTADGSWTSNPMFGDYAGLFDGTTVLQQDPVATNASHLWGFFNGSPDDYGCGGFPVQLALPFTAHPGSGDKRDYLHNEIWSPLIEMGKDVDGLPVPVTGSVTLGLDVYYDLPPSNVVYFRWRVRSMVDGKLGAWRNDGYVYYGGEKVWRRVMFELFPYIEAGASHIQVALGALDLCYQFCGVFGNGSCHSHAPLLDNVAITARETVEFEVTNTADTGSGSLRDAMVSANAFPDRNRIRFNIPGPGSHTISPLSPLPLILWPVAIDATTQPGYAGTPMVAVDGSSAGTSPGFRLETGNSLIAGLAIHGFTGLGIRVNGHRNTIQSNYIGLTAAQVPGPNGSHGIDLYSSAYATVIGGTESRYANLIAYNGSDGVSAQYAGEGNVIRGNSIHSNVRLGIDLSSNGVTANDALDGDAGPNGRQNYPVLDSAGAPANVVDGSLSSTPNSDFLIDLFASAACDPTGFGEGERLVATVPVTTGPDGHVVFSAMTEPLLEGEHITATATNGAGSTSEFSRCVAVGYLTRVPGDPGPADRLALFQNVPNPFNPATSIFYDVPAGGAVLHIAVYDVLGRHVTTLVGGFVTAGHKRVDWNGRNADGQPVATGMYFVRMQSGDFVQAKKMVVLK
jgi:FlgD Ig-like domain/Right handed beta helix region